MRLIDADALKEFIDDCGICAICPHKAPRCSYDCDFPDFVTEKWNVAIDAQPTIDAVSVVHGEWMPNPKIGWGETWVCSICGEKTTSSVMGYPRYNYCPNCGARMEGADDEVTTV